MTPILIIPIAIVFVAVGYVTSRRECQRFLRGATGDDVDEVTKAPFAIGCSRCARLSHH